MLYIKMAVEALHFYSISFSHLFVDTMQQRWLPHPVSVFRAATTSGGHAVYVDPICLHLSLPFD